MESSQAHTPTKAELKARKAAELRGAPFLAYRDDKGKEHLLELDETTRTLTVGRRFEADIALPWDREVSRLHAQFEFRAGEWTVDDDGWSQNGTFVNEMRLDGQRRLQDGDLVRCGQTTIAFCHTRNVSVEMTLVPGELSATPRFSQQQQQILRRAVPAAARRRRRAHPGGRRRDRGEARHRPEDGHHRARAPRPLVRAERDAVLRAPRGDRDPRAALGAREARRVSAA